MQSEIYTSTKLCYTNLYSCIPCINVILYYYRNTFDNKEGNKKEFTIKTYHETY